MDQSRRNFFGTLGKGALAAAATAVTVSQLEVEQRAVAPVKALAAVQAAPAGSAHLAILMDSHGVPVQTMMVNDLPQEIHVVPEGSAGGNPTIFKLVSKDRYDGREVPGLARYIQWKGPIPAGWGRVKLGL